MQNEIQERFRQTIEDELVNSAAATAMKLAPRLMVRLREEFTPEGSNMAPSSRLSLVPGRRQRKARAATIQKLDTIRQIVRAGGRPISDVVVELKSRKIQLHESGIRDIIRRTADSGLVVRDNVVKLSSRKQPRAA